jgi:hypothetical protein
MRRFIFHTAASTTLLACGLTFGVAQDRDHDRDRDDSYYQQRDSYFHDQNWRARLFERVRDDVDRVQASTFPVSKDEFRLVRTKQELNELQDKMAAGRYDGHEVDDVIGTLQRVVDSNKLSPRDRDMLADDLGRIRQYRDHHDEWGNRR